MKQTEHTVKTKLQCLWHIINQLTSPSNIGRMKGEKVMLKDIQLQINHDDARFVATTKTKYTHSRTNHILLITPNKSNDLYYQPHESGKKATIRYVRFQINNRDQNLLLGIISNTHQQHRMIQAVYFVYCRSPRSHLYYVKQPCAKRTVSRHTQFN